MHWLCKDLVAPDLLQDLRHENLTGLINPTRCAIGDDDYSAHRSSQLQCLRCCGRKASKLPLDLWPQRATTSKSMNALQPRRRKDRVIPIEDEASLLL